MVLEGIPDSTRQHRDQSVCEPGVVSPVAHVRVGEPLPREVSVAEMEAWHRR
jgi:hypothetical protein